MKHIGKRCRRAFACMAGVAALGMTTAASAAGSLKAAYVEEVIPAKTFSGRVVLLDNNPASTGPGINGGILGVTSITLTNFAPNALQLLLFAPLFGSGGTCGSPVVSGADPRMQIFVQPHATVQFTYPTPLVFNTGSGVNCIAAQVLSPLDGGLVEMDVNGVIN
jgi:hypothetical protein